MPHVYRGATFSLGKVDQKVTRGCLRFGAANHCPVGNVTSLFLHPSSGLGTFAACKMHDAQQSVAHETLN